MKKLLFSIMMIITCNSAFAGMQQDKMKTCNAEATTKSLQGEARKAFMKDCLSAKPVAAPVQSQQNKMKTCNADEKAKTLKGEARKAFMKDCLSAK